MMRLPAHLTETLRRADVLRRGVSVLAACSGGLDSMVLAHVLADILRRWDGRLTLAYIHHGLRTAADAEREFVLAQADALGVRAVTSAIDVPAACALSPGASVQHVARRLRYDALERLRLEAGAEAILTAHHADDQAETVLLRLLTGAGPGALAGIRPAYGKVLRPLLDVSRAELAAYAAAHGVTWMEDESNASDDYLRNAVRHHVLPAIRAHVNPSIERTLGRTAALHREMAHYLDAEAARLEQDAGHAGSSAPGWTEDGTEAGNTGDGTPDEPRAGVSLAVAALNRYFSFQRFLLVRRVLRTRFGLEARHSDITAAAALVDHAPGALVRLSGGIDVIRSRDALHFTRRHDAADFCVFAPVHGSVQLPDGARFDAVSIPPADVEFTGDPWTECVDLDAVPPPWTLRRHRAGDRFIPFGTENPVHVSRFLSAAHVPVWQRPFVPVLECSNGIIWLCGVRLDARAAVTGRSRRIARLRFTTNTQA